MPYHGLGAKLVSIPTPEDSQTFPPRQSRTINIARSCPELCPPTRRGARQVDINRGFVVPCKPVRRPGRLRLSGLGQDEEVEAAVEEAEVAAEAAEEAADTAKAAVAIGTVGVTIGVVGVLAGLYMYGTRGQRAALRGGG